MFQPCESKTQAVSALFIVDPNETVRVIIYYPLSLGRNFDELYRALIAMLTSDKFNVATPTDWSPGVGLIISPAGFCDLAEERMTTREELDCKDWFFFTKKLDKDLVLDTILKK